MARTIKITVYMNDVPIRTMEEMRENFDLAKATEYFLDGRLLRWLEGRYYEEEAEAIRNLSKDDANLAKKICETLGVEYTGEEIDSDVDKVKILHEKRNKLKQLTDDEEILSHAAQVAFTQEDLADLIDDDEKTIYLCGKIFSVPARVEENRKYIGILGTPEIKIPIKTYAELEARGITFENLNLPESLSKPPAPPEPPEQKNYISGYAVITDTHANWYDANFWCGDFRVNSWVNILRDGKEIYSGMISFLGVGEYSSPESCTSVDYGKLRENGHYYSGGKFAINFDKKFSLRQGDIIESCVDTTMGATGSSFSLRRRPKGFAKIIGSAWNNYEIQLVLNDLLGNSNNSNKTGSAEILFGEITRESGSKIQVWRKGRQIQSGANFALLRADQWGNSNSVQRVTDGNFKICMDGVNFESGDIIVQP